MDVGVVIVQRMHGWIGRKDRQAVAIDAVVHRDDGSTAPVKLSDFSDEGCRIEGENDFRIGERVAIDLPRMGQVKAQIRWALHDSAGVKFLAESDF